MQVLHLYVKGMTPNLHPERKTTQKAVKGPKQEIARGCKDFTHILLFF